MIETTAHGWKRLLDRADAGLPTVVLALALIAYATQLWTEKWIADDGYIPAHGRRIPV